MAIRTAVIAAAGFGTRFIPATKAQAKEMLPIVDKPIIQYLVEEAVASGITNIVLVTRAGCQPLEDHFDSTRELEVHLEVQKKFELLETVRAVSNLANFAYVRQGRNVPYGNGAPLLCARPYIDATEPVAYMFGDDIVQAEVPALKQLIDLFEREQPGAVIAAQKVPHEEIRAYAAPIFKPGTTRNEIESIVEKPDPKTVTTDLAQLGRFVISPPVIDILAEKVLGRGGELWLTDALDRAARKYPILVHEIHGRWLTTGDPLNFLKATVEFALQHQGVGAAFRDYLRQLKL